MKVSSSLARPAAKAAASKLSANRAVAAAPDPRPVAEALAAPGLHLIAEVKRRSPSAGEIAAADDVVARARAYAWFLAAIPICGIIGGPISAALLSLDGWLGLRGWQWLFLLEGIPSVLVGLLVLRLLPERPRDARWLSEGERAWLTRTLEREQTAVHASHAAEMHAALRTPLVWWLGLSYFLLVMALYGFPLWLPQLLKAAAGFSNTEIGFASALCDAVAAVGMVLVGRRSDMIKSGGYNVYPREIELCL